MNTQQLIAGLLQGDFNDAASRTEQRNSEELRAVCNPTPVRIALDNQTEPLTAYVVNASKSGLGLRLSRTFQLRLQLQHGVKVRVEMHRILIFGSIRYCVLSDKNLGFYDVGLRIDEVVKAF